MQAKAFFVIAAIMMLAASSLLAAEGAPHRLGQAGDWANTLAAAVLDGKLYTAEKSGVLYATDLASGDYRPIGEAVFGNTRFLFASAASLFSIEADGSLYRISPADGTYGRLGKAGDWANTLAGAVLDGKLYSAEKSGVLYATDLASGDYRPIGEAVFGNTRFLFASAASLFSIEADGSLYRISPADGTYGRLGKAGDWANTLAGAVLDGKLYSAEKSGVLYATDLADGSWRKLGEPLFADTLFLFASADAVFTIDQGGSLYAIETGPASSSVSSPASPASPANPASPAHPVASSPSEKSAAAVAGNLTFAFLGTWKGDPSAYEKDAAYQEAAKANPQMAQGLLAMIGSAAMKVTLDGITMEVMGEQAGPYAFAVITSEGNDLIIENQDGPKKGVQSTVTFLDSSHIKVVEGAAAAQPMYFVKQ